MNANDRKEVSKLISRLEELKGQIEDVGSELRTLADNEQDKYDNMPEAMQSGEKGDAMQEAQQYLSDAADAAEQGNAEDALDALGNLSL